MVIYIIWYSIYIYIYIYIYKMQEAEACITIKNQSDSA